MADKGDARSHVTHVTMVVLDEVGWYAGGPRDLDRLDDKVRKWLFEPDAPNKQNRREAAKWFRNAANQGDTKAWTLLGHMYGEGYGVPNDHAEAMKLWLKAAEQGEVTAQKSLALMLGFQNKETESENWIRKAAEQGDRWGQRGLGFLYRASGDKVRAYMWYTLAVEQGARKAANERDSLAKSMYREHIAEAQKLAREWRPKK